MPARTAVVFQVLRQIFRTNTTEPVARHRIIDKFRIGQVEIAHDAPKILQRFTLAETRITFLFLSNRRHVAMLVVMSGIDQKIVG